MPTLVQEKQMPDYRKPIHFRKTDTDPQVDNRVGAVLQFESTDRARIQAWLDRAAAAGIIKKTVARQYDANMGGPVWYIP
jgi:uncharacterized glyoxalase superfamily protein PhnB